MIVQSKKDVNSYITIRAADISVGTGEWNNIAKHKNMTKHIRVVKQSKRQIEVSI